MKIFGSSRCALSCAVAALLASCGGPQQIGAPGAAPQTMAIAGHADRGASWMLPEAKGRDLLYVSSSNYQESTVDVYTFPEGKPVGGLVVGEYAGGLCSNWGGDVFVTDGYDIYEFRHGRATPVAIIGDPLGAESCSVDATNGDLAVAGQGGLAIFHPQKRYQWRLPRLFSISNIEDASCGYDGRGNLFFDAALSYSQQLFVELAKGGKQLENVRLNESLTTPGNIEWDGKYLAVGDNNNTLIHRFKIRGTQGTQVDKLSLEGMEEVQQFWIQDGILIGPAFESQWLFGLWPYPQGGSAQSVTEQSFASGATVSVVRPK